MSLSKIVSKGQERSNWCYILKGEDLWKTVIKSWNEMLEEVLARIYLMHHQIVNAIIKHKGKNDFLYEKGGLHFGCRRQFIIDKDCGEVHYILVENDLDNPDSIQTNENGELKHKSPDISELSSMTHLNQHQKDALVNEMGMGIMTEEVDSCWWEMWNKMGWWWINVSNG